MKTLPQMVEEYTKRGDAHPQIIEIVTAFQFQLNRLNDRLENVEAGLSPKEGDFLPEVGQ